MDNRSFPAGELPHELENAIDALTERQREILHLVQAGKANKEVANQLGISEGTVKQHLVTIFRHLGVRNRTMAANLGLLSDRRTRPETGGPTPPTPDAGVEGTEVGGTAAGEAMLYASAMQPVSMVVARLQATESLMHRLGSARFGQLNRTLQQVCLEAARRFCGVMQGIPGGVLLLFGVPHIREDDPERATLCAFQVQQGMADHPAVALLGEALPLRLCILSGEVVVAFDGGKWTLHGDLIAHPCLVSPGSGAHEARPHLSVATRQALRRSAERYGMPGVFLPAGDALRQAFQSPDDPWLPEPELPFVGREGERRELLTFANEARRGASRTVVIVGEAGFGKTRLVREVRAALTADPAWLWLEGSCRTVADQIPGYPLLGLLEQLSGCPAEWDAAAKSARILAWLLEHHPLHAESGRYLLARLHGAPAEGEVAGVAALLLAVLSATRRPTVLFLDNLQWADADTLALFPHLARGCNGSQVWLLGVTRRSWLRSLPGETLVTPFPLGRLTLKSTMQLLKGLHPASSGQEEKLRQMAQWSSGVPLFAAELGKNTRDAQPTDLPTLLSRFPRTLHGLILERLDTVQVDWRVVRAVAAHGRISRQQLRALAIHPPATIDAAVEHLLKIGLLGETGADSARALSFNNEMVRAAIWLTLLEGDRRL
ncbi:MAG: AAA family ATPase [Magnetococcus sp. MYC-9]